MIRIKILEAYKGYKQFNVYNVNENEAHSLIDCGVAEIYRDYPNKMMTSRSKKK